MFVKFCVCPSFPFGIENRMWDMIVLIPDHCLSICFPYLQMASNVSSLAIMKSCHNRSIRQ